LLGHLTAVNDALFPLFGFGERLYPEMHEAFITSPDRSPVQDGFSGEDLKHRWVDVNQALFLSFDKLSPSQWLEKHTGSQDRRGHAPVYLLNSMFIPVPIMASFLPSPGLEHPSLPNATVAKHCAVRSIGSTDTFISQKQHKRQIVRCWPPIGQ